MLSINGIDAYYGKKQILKDVTMNIEEGELITLLGRNGAGKTTLIRSILGVGGVSVNGAITFKSTPLLEKKTFERIQLGIGWVPEERRIFPNLKVSENLRTGSMQSPGENVSVADIYELIPRLEERKEQMGGTLSGGEQQMLSIARTLLTEPELLLIDEPFEGLMPSLVEETIDVLTTLQEEGYSFLIVEQKAQKTLAMSDRGYILDGGQIVTQDDAALLLENKDLLNNHIGIRR